MDADVDSHGDGIPNLQEFLRNTDPCPPPPRTISPGPGDVDGDGTLDAFDNCPGAPKFDQADRGLNGIGVGCEMGVVHDTAAWLHVQPDWSTVVEPTALGVDDEPSFAERVRWIVQFRSAGTRPSRRRS